MKNDTHELKRGSIKRKEKKRQNQEGRIEIYFLN